MSSLFAFRTRSFVMRRQRPAAYMSAGREASERALGSRSPGRDHAALAGALITLRSPGGGDRGGHVIARAPAKSCGAEDLRP